MSPAKSVISWTSVGLVLGVVLASVIWLKFGSEPQPAVPAIEQPTDPPRLVQFVLTPTAGQAVPMVTMFTRTFADDDKTMVDDNEYRLQGGWTYVVEMQGNKYVRIQILVGSATCVITADGVTWATIQVPGAGPIPSKCEARTHKGQYFLETGR